jgi:hypothetical protein
VAVLLVLTGCGSSSDSGSAGAAPSAAASEAQLTAAEAHKIAVASQVQASDLPGFTEDKTAAGAQDAPDASDKEVQACVSGGADPNYLADVSSSDFSRGKVPASLQVSTEAQVVATRKQGEQELAKLQEPATVTCLNNALKKVLSTQAEGGTFEGELKRVESSEDYGSDGAVRYTLDGAIKAQGITITMHVDLDQLLVDRAELTLSQFAIGEKPLSAADRDRVLKAVVDRSRAAQKT